MIARASGVALIEQDRRIHAVQLGTRWAYTAGFVVGLLAFILGAFGVVQIVMALVGAGGLWVVGLVFATIATVCAAVLWLIIKYVRGRHGAALGELPISLVFDLPGGQLCDGAGRAIAPLAEVRVRFRFQVTSSSRALEVCWNGGSIELVSGNPFAGGLGAIVDALQSRGISVG